ncbi:MAG: FecR domain-containing protein [Verrucomicrobia bacterium]|nr:FecR domain-containing protein [Verrucomicrobiota bacterium]
MRRVIVNAAMAAALVAAVFASSGRAGATEEEASANDQEGTRVTAQRGTAEALLLGAAEWVATQIDSSYPCGCELRTGRRSYMEVYFDEANSFRIKADTHVRVGKVLETVEGESGSIVRLVEIEMVDGEVNARLGRLPDDVRVNVTSPSAVAGATGTGFTFIFNRREQETLVKVTHDSVLVGARDRADKQVAVAALQQVEVRPWADGELTAVGRAALDEKELGKESVARFRQKEGADLTVSAVGTAPALDEALPQGATAAERAQRRGESLAAATDAARSALADLIYGLAVDAPAEAPMTTVADVLAQDSGLASKVYELINNAAIAGPTFTDDDACTVVAQLELAALGEALGQELGTGLRGVREITEAGYLATFGADALAATRKAAEADGKRRLRLKLNKSIIDRGRTLEDEANRNANVRLTILGVIDKAVVKETHFYSDGSLGLLMSCILSTIAENHPEIVGTLYMSSPEPVLLGDFMDYRFVREHLAAVREDGGGQSQGALAKAIVKMLGLEDRMDPNATDQDYANFLAAMGAFPIGGWRVGHVATEEDLAVVLVKMLGLLPEVDDPDDPEGYLALLRERGLVLGNIRNLLGNTGAVNPLLQVVGGTPLSGLYQNNVSTVRGF